LEVGGRFGGDRFVDDKEAGLGIRGLGLFGEVVRTADEKAAVDQHELIMELATQGGKADVAAEGGDAVGLRVAVRGVGFVHDDADRNAPGSGRDEGISDGLATETVGGNQDFVLGGIDRPDDCGGGAAVRAGVQFNLGAGGRRRKSGDGQGGEVYGVESGSFHGWTSSGLQRPLPSAGLSNA
jgi:hypothetical protein